MRDFFDSLENRASTLLSFLLALNTLLFVAPQSSSLLLFKTSIHNSFFYVGFAILALLVVVSDAYFSPQFNWKRSLGRMILTGLPAAIILAYGLNQSNNFHYIFFIGLGVYVIATGILISALYIEREHDDRIADTDAQTFVGWFRTQGIASLIFVLFATAIFFSAGFYRLGSFAAVDEPLWLESRIGKYWNNIEQRDWKGTRVSDKPGITVSIATGPGLLSYNPKHFKTLRFEGEIFNRQGIENFYFAFRFPLLLTITLFLPLFYFFLERLVGRRHALISYGLIATSPILVGMSKIINPDSLLWVFTPLSLLSYLVFLKRESYRYLVFAGIFLGLALLTKYVANILFVFLLGLIFLEYLYHPKMAALSFAAYIRKSLERLAFFTFVTLTTFYALFPAVWIKPSKLITSTLYSQAFEKVAPLFLIIIVVILTDQWINKARITTAFMSLLGKAKQHIAVIIGMILLSSLLFTLYNVWSGMSVYNFMDLLASPKTIASRSDFLGIFLTNFYPLVFGVTPFVLIGLLLSPIFFFKKNFFESESYRLSFYLVIFILLYYIGGTVNNVASIVRYQIILFPMAAIVAGIAIEHALVMIRKRYAPKDTPIPVISALAVTLVGAWILLITPFPLSYASSLLPLNYHIDLKDMGPGSFEIAQKLNALPNAKELLIWTDKDGVCKFFIGHCKRGRNYETLRRDGLDYIVVSAARASRTTKMIAPEVLRQEPGIIRFDEYYLRNDPLFKIDINGRPSHFVKVFRFQE